MSARWFYNAPISKVLFYATAVSSLVSIRGAGLSKMSFDINKILASGQVWRLLTYQISFATTSELVFGLSFLYELRKFERMMGVPKFSIFILFVSSLSTTILASLSTIFQINMASGPYSIIYSCLVLHHVFVPVVKPKLMHVLGIDFNEKAFLYLMAFPLILSNGIGSIFPALCGIFSGSLYTSNIAGVQSWRWPTPLEKLLKSISLFIAGSPPPLQAPRPRGDVARPPQRGPGGTADGADANMAEFMRQQAVATPAVAAPSEEDIINLMGMGFDRDTVVAALASSGNSIQIAADRLLGS